MGLFLYGLFASAVWAWINHSEDCHQAQQQRDDESFKASCKARAELAKMELKHPGSMKIATDRMDPATLRWLGLASTRGTSDTPRPTESRS